MKYLSIAKKWAYGLNWQLILLKLGIVASLATALVVWGVSIGKQECAEEKVKEAAAQVQEVKNFVPTVTAQEKAKAEQDARLTKKREEYNEQVEKTVRPPSCDLSTDELRAFQELVEG